MMARICARGVLNRSRDVDVYESLEKPLPKPSAVEYASARLLEALVESLLALEFLERDLVRNAAFADVVKTWVRGRAACHRYCAKST